ncbi:WecB/TagA/CpsF family glycosyltransferase [Caminibacter pacificus]|uniref:N-acetylglucosaminyldiphosphoundecaprenol N-acetyl-beta-D-mannosaminyltransferase n=1 Tax=Caminibacter pacificus TaxID=1424653 RepID=A0AAJ4RBG0_9BACT|nr:WecB/TagA/CpsF family glycosyltransferase [Caminibacter pacificus]QCI29030.1 WecB/TagA/CpsF family glycosyltransferase [Caminibacter pacificus]ROR39153.1 N-acetylglucosaminyldiphosphoundecaprenol N-acetyl-beta-D-mannosaminyltransferase [Caminibacter pacificus]
MKLMGYEVYDKTLDKLNLDIKKLNRFIINTINPHSYVVAKDDELFQKALKRSDVLVPDGSGIVLAAKFINGKRIQKIAGADVHKFLLEKANKESIKVFYMGSSQKTLDKIKEKLKKEYPNIQAGFYSPPFKPEFDEEDNKKIIEAINNFNPDILFVGMTAPKQEKWLYTHKEKINFKVASCIGAVFDFYAGNVKRPPEYIINLHLEWLFRFIQEPKRLWRRNFISTPLFLWDMIKYKFKKS